MPDVPLPKYVISAGKSKLEALQLLKENTLSECYFRGKTVYMGLAYSVDYGTVKYKLGYNTITDDELKYTNADDVQVQVKAIYIKPDNTKVEVSVGDKDGTEVIVKTHHIENFDALKKLANSVLDKHKFTGYNGKITTFLQPFSEPAMKAIITDDKYSERGGTYYITGVNVKADRNGGRRTVEFLMKLT